MILVPERFHSKVSRSRNNRTFTWNRNRSCTISKFGIMTGALMGVEGSGADDGSRGSLSDHGDNAGPKLSQLEIL